MKSNKRNWTTVEYISFIYVRLYYFAKVGSRSEDFYAHSSLFFYISYFLFLYEHIDTRIFIDIATSFSDSST